MKLIAYGLLALVLTGCATVSQGRFTYCDVKKGEGKALDIRAGKNSIERILASPHHLVAYRKEDGTCMLAIEQANPDAVSELSTPLNTLASHTMFTP